MTNKQDLQAKATSFFKMNLRYGIIGLAVGLLICIFISVISGRLISRQNFLLNLMFSLIITLCTANSIFLFQRFWHHEKVKIWQFIPVFYGSNALGALVGIEISFGLVSLIFNTPFHFLQHYSEYRFSGIIVIVVSTIVYFYHAQKAALNARLKAKELDLA